MTFPPSSLRYGSWRDIEMTRLEEQRCPNHVRNFWIACIGAPLFLLALKVTI